MMETDPSPMNLFYLISSDKMIDTYQNLSMRKGKMKMYTYSKQVKANEAN